MSDLPPTTATSLVDFLLHTEMMTGEMRSDTEEETETSQVVPGDSWPTTVPRLLK